MRALAAIWLLAAAVAARADEVTVFSPRAEAVSVTIYRDDLALITETRTVDLPAEPVTLVIQGVVESLLPQSAVVTGAERPLAESNFSFDRLTPASLIEHSVGETVMLTRTHPRTGRVTRAPATILAAGKGVVLQTADGYEAVYCAGLPSRLEFQRLPEGLLAKPQLSVRLAAGEPGERALAVSYLAHGFEWSSDYVAHLNERGNRLQLTGWVTLRNHTATAFEQAQVQVVAGRLNLIDAEDGGSRAVGPYYFEDAESALDARDRAVREEADGDVALLGSCYDVDLRVFAPESFVRFDRPQYRMLSALEEIVVTAARVASREELGDYQLYRLPWSTDLGARQTKQAVFLSKPAVRVERLYGFRLADFDESPEEDVLSPSLLLRWENTARAGLGEPLPSGRVRVFEPYAGSRVFAGEAQLDDKPVGLPVELEIGRALNLTLEITTEDRLEGGNDDFDRVAVVAEHRVSNNKGVPIEMEIRHGVSSRFKEVEVRESSRLARRKYGDLMWRFKVPAGGVQVLSYELEAIEE